MHGTNIKITGILCLLDTVDKMGIHTGRISAN